jgi:hypothetical protein
VTDAGTCYLSGTGWTSWERARQELDGCTCLWVDVNRVHHGSPPDRQPVGATHLWGWQPGKQVRVRFDGAEVAVAVLRDVRGEGVPVPTRRRRGEPWGGYERAGAWDKEVTLTVVETPLPLTFIHSIEGIGSDDSPAQ